MQNGQGRLTSAPRLMGKLGFVHVFVNGEYQQLMSRADLPTWEAFQTLHQGDIVRFDGELFLTKTGENTVRLDELEILRKCELALPDRMNGVSVGVSRQNRYLELLAEQISPERNLAYRETIILRSRLLASIRESMSNGGYIEVTTPTLIENAFGCDAKPFVTDGYYLRIAPELELKKLIVGGFDKIYEIGKSFRNEGLSQKHNPEFTMLEYYETGGNYEDAMQSIRSLLVMVIMRCFGTLEVNGINWGDWSEVDDITDFDEAAVKNPTFFTDFTAEESPLARSRNGKAERFELYVGGMELANGYSEQDDWDIQEAVFESQGVVDADYINALKTGLPPTFGVGVGIDRLIMLLTGRGIKEVL